MIKISNLLLQPSKFFHNLKESDSCNTIKALLWGLGIGILSQFILFIIDHFLFRKNPLIELIDSEIFIVENYSKIKIQILLSDLIIYTIIIPIVTILFRIVFGFIIIKLMGYKKETFSEIIKIVCFSMISNFILIIPIIGFYLGSCYLFFLLFLGSKMFFKTNFWQALIFATILTFISFQPFFYAIF